MVNKTIEALKKSIKHEDILIAELEKIIEKTSQGEYWLDLVKSIEPQPEKEPELVEKWVDITIEIKWRLQEFTGGYWLMGSYKDKKNLLYFHANGLQFNATGGEENYCIEHEVPGTTLGRLAFRIKKKEMVSK